jgi:hypothetical protein
VLTPWRDKVAGLLEAWYPGEEGGTAIARVLFGDVDPGGRLPATFPVREADEPVAGDPEKYPGVNETVQYKEGVLVGYRWFDEKGLDVAYPFGHGLSYTTFAYSGLRAGPDGVSVTVTNTGRRAGTDVPQLYLGFPDTKDAPEPPRQLKGFEKVSLEPGASRTVRFALDARSFSHWDTAANDWAITPGCYDVLVGASSRDVREQGVIAQGGAACAGSEQAAAAGACAEAAGFRSASLRAAARRLAIRFTRAEDRPARVDVFAQSRGRRVVGERLIARFAGLTDSFTWDGRANRPGARAGDGYYVVRLQAPFAGGRLDTRRFVARRVRGRFQLRPAYAGREACGLVRSVKLTRPVFGGSTRRPLQLSLRLGRRAKVSVTVLRGKRTFARFRTATLAAGRLYRYRLRPRGTRPGDYRVRVRASVGSGAVTTTLTARRL